MQGPLRNDDVVRVSHVASRSKTGATGRPAARKVVAKPARRLTPKGEATRNRLIDLAAEVFADEGYAAVSMRDIAARSGLSSGAIYGSFRGKAEHRTARGAVANPLASFNRP